MLKPGDLVKLIQFNGRDNARGGIRFYYALCADQRGSIFIYEGEVGIFLESILNLDTKCRSLSLFLFGDKKAIIYSSDVGAL